jgi:hypothetical protein
MKAQLDKILNKFISRKLSVFIVSCFGLFSGTIESGDWVIISTGYIMIQGVTDIVQRIKFNNKTDNQ